MLFFVALFILLFCHRPFCTAADTISLAIPPSPTSSHVVQGNFLGISFELSFMDEYFGNDTSTIPPTIVNYLASLRSRTGKNSLRVRIGGNSMDSSTYVPSQTSPMVQMISEAANANDQPVNFGPVLWDVMNKVSSDVGGTSFLIGLSLLDPNNLDVPLLAGAAAKKLAKNLDGFLLGNEPDLYTSHQDRPNVQNYTTTLYINDFRTASNHLTNTSAGNILEQHDIGGPTICCSWNLDALLDDGYTASFGGILKYISLQHYPQNICDGSYQFGIPYYVQHANVVGLAAWQNSGIGKVLSGSGPNRQEIIMSEFNSASCGGVPTISDSFAVGALWTIDYALQMASVGYSAAYLHTRERGISYNAFTTPDGPSGSSGSWTTNSPFYSLLVTAKALGSSNGSIVVDLDIGGSKSNLSATVSGYAIYDSVDSTVRQLVFFNYANTSSSKPAPVKFNLPANTFPANSSNSVMVKYLVGDSLAETKNIGWGGKTFANVGDGKLVSANATWAPPDSAFDCTNGCTINIPSPGMAVVFAGSASITQPNKTSTQSNTTTLSPSITTLTQSITTSTLLTDPGTTTPPSKVNSGLRATSLSPPIAHATYAIVVFIWTYLL